MPTKTFSWAFSAIGQSPNAENRSNDARQGYTYQLQVVNDAGGTVNATAIVKVRNTVDGPWSVLATLTASGTTGFAVDDQAANTPWLQHTVECTALSAGARASITACTVSA